METADKLEPPEEQEWIDLDKTLTKRDKLDKQLKKMEDNLEVSLYLDLMDEREEVNEKAIALTKSIAGQITDWSPDRFTKGKKEVFRKGEIEILRSTTTTRIVIPKLAVEKYPFIVNMMVETGKVKIPVTVIEGELKDDELEEIIERVTTHQYEAVRKAGLKEEENGNKKDGEILDRKNDSTGDKGKIGRGKVDSKPGSDRIRKRNEQMLHTKA